MKTKLLTLALAALTIGLLGSCKKEDPKVSVTGVTLDQTELTLTVGEPDVKLAATVAPENATDKTVSWASDKTEFATVDNQGNVHAVAPGTANITVTTTDGNKTATCAVTVKAAKVSVTGVTLDQTELTLTVGEPDVKLAATVAPENATDKTVSWASDKTEFATVDNQGNVHAVAPGTANITVTTTDGNKTATCAVTVKAAKVSVTGVTLDQTELTLTVGDPDVKLAATVAPENATDKTVSWSSDKTDVATVDQEGNVHAVAEGTATITVTTTDGNKTATCAVTVKESLLYEWELLGIGLFTDDTVCPLYSEDPVTVPVKVYQEKTNKGLYKISDHALQICCAAFGVTEEVMRQYEGGNWRNADIILDASNPTSVKWELQDYGVCFNPAEGFIDGVTNMYNGAPYSKGTLSNGVISWPTPGGMLCTINGDGYYKADVNGKQAIKLPSAVTTEAVEAAKAAMKNVKPMKNISLIKADAQFNKSTPKTNVSRKARKLNATAIR